MNIENFRNYCLSLPATSESLPFDENTLVFKVGSKMFALTGLNNTMLNANLKCDPAYALELREQYSCISPGFHMNKKHWNSINPNECLDSKLFYELVKHSYDLVVAKMTKKERSLLLNL
jgi:predicted DNA-binding protein (MmcQ/YjbR family)